MFDIVIGLETHLQLSTETKIFCGCRNIFGEKPNSCVCPVCLGHPGALPVLNARAFEYAIKVALALDCKVQSIVKFDRKNYYYPDLPKNYQISQFDMPIAYDGKITVRGVNGEPVTIGITRAHLEEDAGKLLHDTGGPFSYVDLNRAGTPLLEIVTEPDMTSPEDAYSYLTELKRRIKYLDVSDCNMEEGSLRCDANISLKPRGSEKLGRKVEIKNLNSFKAVRDALSFEAARQVDILEDGGTVVMETRLWDEKRCVTVSMRSKEEAHDYRYFPEPDLVPFEIDERLISRVEETLPELPAVKQERFMAEYGLSFKDADVLVEDRDIAVYFERAASLCGDPQGACNWIKGEIMMHINERNESVSGLGVSPEDLSELIGLVSSGKISGLVAKDVLKKMITEKRKAGEIVCSEGLEQVSDTGSLEAVIDEVIAKNEKSVNDYRTGKKAAIGFLVGQVMKLTKGKANPKIAGKMFEEKLK